jgi:hypothetical protein
MRQQQRRSMRRWNKSIHTPGDQCGNTNNPTTRDVPRLRWPDSRQRRAPRWRPKVGPIGTRAPRYFSHRPPRLTRRSVRRELPTDALGPPIVARVWPQKARRWDLFRGYKMLDHCLAWQSSRGPRLRELDHNRACQWCRCASAEPGDTIWKN